MLRVLFILSLAISTYANDVKDKKENETEFGLGAGFISAPLYIGSKTRQNYTVPFPYIDYKGEYLNINRDKIYNDYYNSNNLKVELSLSGMLPVNSDKASKRDGMPDLGLSIDIGPKLIYNLYKTKYHSLDMELPIRANFAIESDIKSIGFTMNSSLHYQYKIYDYTFNYYTGINYGSDEYHSYYYGVESKYATANRQSYNAKAGYSGFHNSFSFTKKTDNWWMGVFLKHYNLNNTVFEDSPLVETNEAIFYGAAISYIF
jgi:outer membrane scaffolding protein for murein synthesis (MipA/OmpV family)